MGQISCQAVPPLLKGTYMLNEISNYFLPYLTEEQRSFLKPNQIEQRCGFVI